MNVYWHTAAGKIEKAAFNLPEAEAEFEAERPSELTVLLSTVMAPNVDDHYINNGAVESKPARPSQSHTWSYDTQEWIDPRTLGDIKAAQWTAIKAQRDAVEFGGYTWDGSGFDSDSQSQSRIMGAAQLATLAAMAEQPFSIDWTLTDNTVRTLAGADMIAAGQALGVHVGAAHATARALRAAIESATTQAEVEAVQWT